MSRQKQTLPTGGHGFGIKGRDGGRAGSFFLGRVVMLGPACRVAFSRCRRCLRVSQTPATLASAALRSGRGSVHGSRFRAG